MVYHYLDFSCCLKIHCMLHYGINRFNRMFLKLLKLCLFHTHAHPGGEPASCKVFFVSSIVVSDSDFGILARLVMCRVGFLSSEILGAILADANRTKSLVLSTLYVGCKSICNVCFLW